MNAKLFIAAVVLLLVDTASFGNQAAAYSHGACGTHDELMHVLGDTYKEAPVAMAIVGDGHGILEILATKDGSTWSMVVTDTSNNACLIGAGNGWTMREWRAPEPPSVEN